MLSSHYHEFSPFSVLEAMGAGVPVVAMRGSVLELIGLGRCVPMGDAPTLAERVRALCEQPGPSPRRRRGAARPHPRAPLGGALSADLLELYERAGA